MNIEQILQSSPPGYELCAIPHNTLVNGMMIAHNQRDDDHNMGVALVAGLYQHFPTRKVADGDDSYTILENDVLWLKFEKPMNELIPVSIRFASIIRIICWDGRPRECVKDRLTGRTHVRTDPELRMPVHPEILHSPEFPTVRLVTNLWSGGVSRRLEIL